MLSADHRQRIWELCAPQAGTLCDAASHALDLFLAANFTGGAPDEVDLAAGSLDVDGEEAVGHVVNPALLLFCQTSLDALATDDHVAARKLMNALVVHQSLLTGPSPTLAKRFEDLIPVANIGDSDANLQAEIAVGFMGFGMHPAARRWIERAQATLGMAVSLTGSMGKRTKFQKEDRAQLVLQVTLNDDVRPVDDDDNERVSELMPDVPLDDDLLLERVALSSAGDALFPTRMLPIHRAVLLVLADLVDAENVLDDIKRIEQLAYIDHVVPCCSWSIRLRGLARRSILDCRNPHTCARALSQFEALVASAASTAAKDLVHGGFFLAQPIPLYSLRLMHAEHLERMALHAAALSIYTDLDVWEPMMRLHVRLGRRAEAQAMLEARMEAYGPTPRLQCILGDVTMDAQWYHRAWDLSERRYARAKRALGEIDFGACRWRACIDHFREALAINPMFPKAWYAMGYAAMQVKDFPTAVTAFARCVKLTPENGDAQNNLAAAYLETRALPQAFHALKECIRLKPDDWQVWDNFLTASMGVRDLQSAVKAFAKLAELQQAPMIDMGLLGVFCDAVTEDPSEFLRGKTVDLLGSLSCALPSCAPLFHVALRFYDRTGDDAKALESLRKRCLALESGGDWARNRSDRDAFLAALRDLVNRDAASRSTRLLVNRVSARAQKELDDAAADVFAELSAQCQSAMRSSVACT
ncbi:Tetratricopeptide repeat [Plasmodiophora brassicae]